MVKVILLGNQDVSTNLLLHPRKLICLGLFLISILLIYTYKSGNRENLDQTAFRYKDSEQFSLEESANDLLEEETDEIEFEIVSDKSKFEITSNESNLKTTTNEPKSKIIFHQPKLETMIEEFQYPHYTLQEYDQIDAAKECYKMKESDASLQLLNDIENPPPKPDKSIFFIDTTCLNNSVVTLNARQACSIESAAALNPNRDVYVLFVSPVGFVQNEPDSPVIAALKSYSNVHFRNVNIYEFSKDTPAEQWIKKDKIFLSKNFIVHLSDYLRFVALLKYGGVYEDLDFINIKSMDGLPQNFAPQENPNMEYINNSVLGFSAQDVGHKIIEMILRECFEKYKPNAWDYNGPLAIWRATKKICKTSKMVDMMRPEYCWGFKITPQTVFFPFAPFNEAFDTNPQNVTNALNKLTNETVAIHLWSSNTNKITIIKSAHTSAYSTLAQKFCPKSFESSGPNFD